MKKIDKKTKTTAIEDKILIDKVIDLCLWYQIEDSHRWMDVINLQIKNCQIQLEYLLENKPFWFQKKKLKEHNKQIDELENQIYKYYENLGKEVDMIEKMQNAINSKDKE